MVEVDKAIQAAMPSVTEAISRMAQSLGIAAEHLYGVLIKQMVAEGVAYASICVVVLLLSLALAIGSIVALRRALKGGSEALYGVALVTGIPALMIGVIALTELPENVMKTLNPEYYAIERIIKQLK